MEAGIHSPDISSSDGTCCGGCAKSVVIPGLESGVSGALRAGDAMAIAISSVSVATAGRGLL